MGARIQLTSSASEIAIVSNAAALNFPPSPGAVALVPAAWSAPLSPGVIPAFDLSIWSTGSLTLTNAELLGGMQRAQAQAGQGMTTIDFTTDQITKAGHGYSTGDGPVQATTSGTLPGALALLTDYYIIVIDPNTIKLATTLANALAGIAIDITSNGSGTLTLTGTAACARVFWHSFGLLPASITLTNQRAFAVRCQHRPRTIAYALVGTLSAGTLSASVEPVYEG